MNVATRDGLRESRLASAVKASTAESNEAFSRKRANYNRKVTRDDKLHMPKISMPRTSGARVFQRLIDTAVGLDGTRRLAPKDRQIRVRDHNLARARLLDDKKYGVKHVPASPEVRAQAAADVEWWQESLVLAQPWRRVEGKG